METGNPDDDFDEEAEELHQAMGGEANLASGASFRDLEHSYDVIGNGKHRKKMSGKPPKLSEAKVERIFSSKWWRKFRKEVLSG